MKKITNLLFFLLLLSALEAQSTTETNYITQLFHPGRASNMATIISKINGNTEYQVTPGDVYTIFVRSKNAFNGSNSDLTINLALSNTYELEVPYIGTQKLKEMTFFQARDMIIKKIKNTLPTLEYANVTLKSPAIFEVFVYGDVPAPGIIDVTALNRVHEAIALCGGMLPGGSYRKLQITKNGSTTELDYLLYHTQADLSQDPFLEPGMKVFVPPAELLVQLNGKVAFPGLYELKEKETLADLIKMSGCLLPESRRTGVQISRLGSADGITILYPPTDEWDKITLNHGDVVNIPSALSGRPTILIEGALYANPDTGTSPRKIPLTPVMFTIPFLPGMNLLEVLELYGGPTPFAEAEKSVLRRKSGEELSLDIRRLWETKDRSGNILLEEGDYLFIPMQNLTVIVSGLVNNPGSFPYRTKATVGDYILLAGGIQPDKGSQRALYLISASGQKTRLSLTDTLKPGSVIYVGKNAWGNTEYTIGQITTIVTVTAALIGLTQTIMEFYIYTRDTFRITP